MNESEFLKEEATSPTGDFDLCSFVLANEVDDAAAAVAMATYFGRCSFFFF